MTLADIIIIVLVPALVGAAAIYICREKKQGKCVGCPYAKECAARKKGAFMYNRGNGAKNLGQ